MFFFAKGKQPLQFGARTARVSQDFIDKWLPWKSQIATVEMFAVVVALETFRSEIDNQWILMLVDSKPVPGAFWSRDTRLAKICASSRVSFAGSR